MKVFRYSTLSDAHKCLRFFELKHIKGMDDGSDKSGDMAFGTTIHAAIQDLFEIGNGTDVFSDLWGAQKNVELEYSRYKWEDLRALGETLISIFRDEHQDKFVPQYLEKRLETRLARTSADGDNLLQFNYHGTVDFLGTFNGIPSVVDWKTSAMPYDRFKIQCNEQMYGYANLAKHCLGFDAQQVVYAVAIKDMKNPKWQFRTAPLSDKIVQSKIDNIFDTAMSLQQGPYYKNPNQCVVGKRVCPFFNTCHGGDSGKEGA